MKGIAHIVIWRLNGQTPDHRAQQAQAVVHVFESSRHAFPGLVRMEVGHNIIDGEDAWDVALYMVFETRAHLDIYQTHPAHTQIKAVVGPMRTMRGQVDFEISL
jgi:hypothetical protein